MPLDRTDIDLCSIHSQQRAYFDSGITKNPAFRVKQLSKLKDVIKTYEDKLFAAVENDLGKCRYEAYLTELGVLYRELDFFISNVHEFCLPVKVKNELANVGGKCYLLPEPLGCSLVLSPWNYPVQLSLIPLFTAMAAGNTVILKPSENAPACSALITEMVNKHFDLQYIHTIEGGPGITQEILKLKFDKIFFTGSSHVGKLVYKAAAENLTPVTLELGGKSPAVVLPDVNISMAVKKILWGKFINSGQTCIAPDYVLVHEKVKDQFLQEVKNEIENRYKECDTFVRIINEKHFDRLLGLIDESKIFIKGKSDRIKLHLGPTVLTDVHPDDKVMQEEIFGPVLPVMSFLTLSEAKSIVKSYGKPLAFYIFSGDKKSIDDLLHDVSFGGCTINDTIMHFTNNNLPFGGVGESGLGSYHGEAGFRTFSHYKSVMEVPLSLNPVLKYQPYSNWKYKLLRWFFEKISN
ncbi:MAG: aldehyde dehydrogenase family protein [Cytophagaceae bacterium]